MMSPARHQQTWCVVPSREGQSGPFARILCGHSTGSPDHLFSRRSQCLSEAAFTIWLDCAPFCFRLSFAVRARQVRRARGSASPGGWSRISRRDHVTYSASPARPRCGEGGRAGRDIPGRSVTEAGPGELPHQSPLKHHPGCGPVWCKGTVRASPSVPPCQGHGKGTRAPGQSSQAMIMSGRRVGI